MANVIARFKKGKLTANVVEGDYKGKKTRSYTINKSIKTDDGWKDTDFLGITDMQDLQSLTQAIINKYVKFEKVEPKPKEEQYEPQDEEVPF